MLKKCISGFLGAAVILTSITVPAFAARTSVLDVSELKDASGVVIDIGTGYNKDDVEHKCTNTVANVTEDGAAATKLTFTDVKRSDIGGETFGYANSREKFSTRIKIPFTVPAGAEKFEVSFDAKHSNNTVIAWANFGSVYNSDYTDNWSCNPTSAAVSVITRTYGADAFGTGAQMYLNSCNAIGAETAYTTTTEKPYGLKAASTNYSVGTDWYTVKMSYDLTSGKFVYSLNDKTSSEDVYMINRLTQNDDGSQSGYIVFSGYFFGNGNTTPSDVFLRNVKVAAITDTTKVPISYTFDESGFDPADSDMEYKIGSGVTGKDACINKVEVATDEKSTTNKALKLTFTPMAVKDGGTETSQTSWSNIQDNYNTKLKIPYSGLKDDENLKISYKTRQNAEDSTINWANFATLFDSSGNVLIYGPRKSATEHSKWGWIPFNSVNVIASNTAGKSYKEVESDPTYVSSARKEIKDQEWHTVTLLISRDGSLQTYFDGELTGEQQYIFGSLTNSGYLYFEGYYNYYGDVTRAATEHWIDDVKMEAWKPLTVTSNMADNYDAEEDIVLNFSNDVASEPADIKSKISVTQNGESISPSRMVVTMDDSKTARVKITGGLKYNSDIEFKLAAGLVDTDGITMTDDYTQSFKTRLSKSLFAKVNSSGSESGSVTANVTVTNPTAEEAPAYVALAVYNSSNKMIGISVKEFTSIAANGGTASENLTASFADGETPNNALVMIWDTKANLNAYHMAIDVPLN